MERASITSTRGEKMRAIFGGPLGSWASDSIAKAAHRTWWKGGARGCGLDTWGCGLDTWGCGLDTWGCSLWHVGSEPLDGVSCRGSRPCASVLLLR